MGAYSKLEKWWIRTLKTAYGCLSARALDRLRLPKHSKEKLEELSTGSQTSQTTTSFSWLKEPSASLPKKTSEYTFSCFGNVSDEELTVLGLLLPFQRTRNRTTLFRSIPPYFQQNWEETDMLFRTERALAAKKPILRAVQYRRQQQKTALFGSLYGVHLSTVTGRTHGKTNMYEDLFKALESYRAQRDKSGILLFGTDPELERATIPDGPGLRAFAPGFDGGVLALRGKGAPWEEKSARNLRSLYAGETTVLRTDYQRDLVG